MAKKSRKSTGKAKTSAKKSSRKASAKKTTRKTTNKSAKKPAKKSAKKTAKKSSAKTSKKTSRKAGGGKSKAKKTSSKPKTHLGKAELKEFRQRLLEKRRDILGDMGGMQSGHAGINPEEGISAAPSMPTHPADVGSDNFEHEFTLGLLQSERALLQEIDEALERIANRTYGICMGTGEPINKARLRARPWAKYCIEYARMVEKGLVRPSDEPQQNRREEDEDLDENEDLEDIEDEDTSDDADSEEVGDEDAEDED